MIADLDREAFGVLRPAQLGRLLDGHGRVGSTAGRVLHRLEAEDRPDAMGSELLDAATEGPRLFHQRVERASRLEQSLAVPAATRAARRNVSRRRSQRTDKRAAAGTAAATAARMGGARPVQPLAAAAPAPTRISRSGRGRCSARSQAGGRARDVPLRSARARQETFALGVGGAGAGVAQHISGAD